MNTRRINFLPANSKPTGVKGRPLYAPREDGATARIIGPDGVALTVPSWLAKVYTEAQKGPQQAAAPAPAPAPAAAPATTTLKVAGETLEVPHAFAAHMRSFLETPAGATAVRNAMAQREEARDAAACTARFMGRAGYDGRSVEVGPLLDPVRRRLLYPLDSNTRQDSATPADVDQATVEFMKRAGY